MESPSPRRLHLLFVALGLLTVVLVVFAYYRDEYRDWKTIQRHYIAEEIRRAASPHQRAQAAAIPVEIRQVVLPEIKRVDRCVTCHLSVEDPSYAGFPQPLGYHPHHERHSFEKFGCTVCHRGQGRATTKEDAHGHVEHWDQPMLPMKYIQASCGQCHQAADNPAAPLLARGAAIFRENGCAGCHELGGVGGSIGPRLDNVGDHRSPEWLKRHFADPASVTPGSGMPPQKFTEADLDAITLYMLSQTSSSIGGFFSSMKVIPSPAEGRRLFVAKGCISCHSLGGKGGSIGPALDEVSLRRTPAWIMQHFRDPASVSPGSTMPRFGFSEAEARALTDFLLHLREQKLELSLPSLLSPAERGREVYRKYGCAGCHGQEGKGGIPNPNAKTAQLVPDLIKVAEGYTREELRTRIRKGQREINSMDPKLPPPPLYMPAWGDRISPSEYDDLVEFLYSLKPKDDDAGF